MNDTVIMSELTELLIQHDNEHGDEEENMLLMDDTLGSVLYTFYVSKEEAEQQNLDQYEYFCRYIAPKAPFMFNDVLLDTLKDEILNVYKKAGRFSISRYILGRYNMPENYCDGYSIRLCKTPDEEIGNITSTIPFVFNVFVVQKKNYLSF